MYIKTTIPVNYNDGISSQSTSIIEGHILSSAWTNGEYSQLGFNFEYKTEPDGEGNQKTIAKDGFTINKDVDPEDPTKLTIEQLYQIVKDSVPGGLTYAETQQYLHYLGFIQEMANTYSILPSEIEIIP